MNTLVYALISPLGTALVLAFAACGVALGTAPRGARRWPVRLVLAALLWLWLWSTPWASHALRGWLEQQAGPRRVEQVAPAPALVVLGGGVASSTSAGQPYPDIGPRADRVWHAARLFHAGKAPLLVLAGGPVHDEFQSEADSMAVLLLDLGVPAQAMVKEERSHNTRTNARYVAELLAARNIRSAILVTSALHMPRARAAFERAGLAVVPAPTDFEAVERPMHWSDAVPDAWSLDGSFRAFKEVLGRWAGA
jgi:uncharacterized SAM-binding protein YcdF (DUF218 family)